ncbi:MAG: hypothetical protein ACR2QM_16220 [Longimicrobiales bacterium]
MKDDSVNQNPPERGGLDPRTHPDRWEGIVARINKAAGPLLAARQPASLAQIVAGWSRPLLFGSAGLVGAAALALLAFPSISAEADEVTLAAAVMPWTVAGWMDGSYSPTVEELVLAVGEAQPEEPR